MNAVLDHPATGHATVASMRANGGRAALRISSVAYPTRQFDTPSGKIEFWSEKAQSMGLNALPQAPTPPEADDLLTLAQGRTFAHFHGFYDHARALPALAAREPEPVLWIAQDDGARRGIADGDAIDISSPHGSFRATAKVTNRIPQGTVWMRSGWPGFNALTDGSAVLPETALEGFAFSVGQSNYGARVSVAPARAE